MLSLYFPSVIIQDLTITAEPDSNQMNMSLTYSIKDTGTTDNLQLAFN